MTMSDGHGYRVTIRTSYPGVGTATMRERALTLDDAMTILDRHNDRILSEDAGAIHGPAATDDMDAVYATCIHHGTASTLIDGTPVAPSAAITAIAIREDY